MLVLKRHPREKILIGDDITVMVIRVEKDGGVRIGIEAPDYIAIDREEIRKSKESK